MRLLLLSIIFVLFVKYEYTDRELRSLIIEKDNILMINKSNTASLEILAEQKKENTNLLLQREKRRLKQQGELIVTTESLHNLLYKEDKYHSYWPDDVIEWLQQPY